MFRSEREYFRLGVESYSSLWRVGRRGEKSVSTFGQMRLWTSFESSPVSVKGPFSNTGSLPSYARLELTLAISCLKSIQIIYSLNTRIYNQWLIKNEDKIQVLFMKSFKPRSLISVTCISPMRYTNAMIVVLHPVYSSKCGDNLVRIKNYLFILN